MATKYYSFTGEIQWANNLTYPDDKFPTNDGARVYRCNLKLDDASLKVFTGSGLRLKLKNGNEVTFRRPEFKTMKGEKVDLGAPKLINSPDRDVLIGNGSIVTARVSVFDAGKFGLGHRLESVTIDKLIEYKKPEPTEDTKALPF